MVIAARVLRLLAFAVWMGALVFFGAVVAPTAFRTFGTTEPFADFIGARAYRLAFQAGLVLLMIVLTFASNKLIILPMEHDRALAGGNINIMLSGSPLREDFDARHAWSTRVEGVVVLAGLGLAVLIGMEAGLRERLPAGPPRKVFDLSDDEE